MRLLKEKLLETTSLHESSFEVRENWCFGDQAYYCQMALLPGNVVYSAPSGWSKLENTQDYLKHLQEILEEFNLESEGFVILEDYSGLDGADSDAREEYIKILNEKEGLKGVIYVGTSKVFTLIIKAARMIRRFETPICIEKTISDGLLKAQSLLNLDVPEIPIIKENTEELDSLMQSAENFDWIHSEQKIFAEYPENASLFPIVEALQLIQDDVKEMLNDEYEKNAEIEKEASQSEALSQELLETLEEVEAFRIATEKENEWNLELNTNRINHQKELIFSLGEMIETRSKETANHIRRVAEYSALFARLLDLEKYEVDYLIHASPMHDIGKIGIPDAILNKAGKLSFEEFKVIQKHPKVGYDLLKGTSQEIMQAAATIAYQHHEKWNGKGYPNGLKGDEIHIYGRITALADVFDALGSERCYKKAWPLEKILALLKEERGEHFDPHLIDLFFANLDDFLEIRNRLADVNTQPVLENE